MELIGIYSESGTRKDLWFKSALLRQDPNNTDHYLAQFDDLHLKEAFGWHTFKKEDFVNVRRLGED